MSERTCVRACAHARVYVRVRVCVCVCVCVCARARFFKKITKGGLMFP